MRDKRTILIVDDDEFFLHGLSETLEFSGFHTLTAKSWVDITELLSETIPDLILLDLVIPSLDGEKICDILKKQKKSRHIPILLYSGKKHSELEEIAQRCGAEGFIEKTNDFEQVVINILRFLKNSNS